MLSKLCFKESLVIINENEEELGEFIGKIRPCHSNTNSSSILVNLHSISTSVNGEENGMSLITKTTTTFDTYEEKWSQWLLFRYKINRTPKLTYQYCLLGGLKVEKQRVKQF